jgi:hypothetical protein
MIFTNNISFIVLVFLVLLILQYIRYRRIAGRNLDISGLLLLKILIRSITLSLFILISKIYLIGDHQQDFSQSDATCVVKTSNPNFFKLTEDDRVNIVTRIPDNKISHIQLLLFNPITKSYYVYIPFTSVKTFVHLLKIERSEYIPLLKANKSIDAFFRPKQRIELFEQHDNRWILSQTNQSNYNLFNFLNNENELISPYLLHYLLILILFLLAIDLGIKYRILKI